MKKTETKKKKFINKIDKILKDVPRARKGTASKSIREDRDKS